MGRITIEKLNKAYANRRKLPRSDENPQLRKGDDILVLNMDIDLKISDGEMVCFLGPSGMRQIDAAANHCRLRGPVRR